MRHSSSRLFQTTSGWSCQPVLSRYDALCIIAATEWRQFGDCEAAPL